MPISNVRRAGHPPLAPEPCGGCDVRHRGLCDCFDDVHLSLLASAAVVKEIDKGQVFVREGEPADRFHKIRHGTAKLFKTLSDGRQQIIAFATEDDFLGLAVSDVFAFSAEAIEPVSLCRFSRRQFRALAGSYPELEHRLLQTACSELVLANEQMLLLGRKTARERVASFLLEWNAHDKRSVGDRHVRLPMTRLDIADYLGLTIETVSRALNALRREGRIDIPSPSLVVLRDRPWLENAASGLHDQALAF